MTLEELKIIAADENHPQHAAYKRGEFSKLEANQQIEKETANEHG